MDFSPLHERVLMSVHRAVTKEDVLPPRYGDGWRPAPKATPLPPTYATLACWRFSNCSALGTRRQAAKPAT